MITLAMSFIDTPFCTTLVNGGICQIFLPNVGGLYHLVLLASSIEAIPGGPSDFAAFLLEKSASELSVEDIDELKHEAASYLPNWSVVPRIKIHAYDIAKDDKASGEETLFWWKRGVTDNGLGEIIEAVNRAVKENIMGDYPSQKHMYFTKAADGTDLKIFFPSCAGFYFPIVFESRNGSKIEGGTDHAVFLLDTPSRYLSEGAVAELKEMAVEAIPEWSHIIPMEVHIVKGSSPWRFCDNDGNEKTLEEWMKAPEILPYDLNQRALGDDAMMFRWEPDNRNNWMNYLIAALNFAIGKGMR